MNSNRNSNGNKNWLLQINNLSRLTKQLIAGVMSISLVGQPLIANAQLSADPNAGAANRPNIGAAPNGVPMVDIATPNGAGLSHNKYHDFNVGAPGVILNNHNQEVGLSALGGVTPGNANLRQSGPASVILNEVTSGNRSTMEGAVEVFGHRADVVIANPNGITCNGCGFINTPRATLTTGIPTIGLDGSLTGFDVRGGDVTFGAKGANLASGAGSVDIFDVVSRTVRIEGPVAGHDIGLTAGTGQYDYASREMKELYDIAGKPEYAIDGSALGALQADRIKLVATEKGVGVRMRSDMAANAGQLTLSADGKISLNNTSGRDGVHIKSARSSVSASKITSKNTVTIKADKGITLETIGADGDIMADVGNGLLTATGDIIAGGNLSLSSTDKIKAAQLASGGHMELHGDQGIDVLVAIANGSANLSSQYGDITATNGIKASGGDLTITADKGSINSATLISFNNMTLNAGLDLNITGNVLASRNIKATVGRNMTASSIAGGVNMAATDQNGSLVLGQEGSVNLVAQTGSIHAANIYGAGNLDLKSAAGTDIKGTLNSNGDIVIQAQNQSVRFDQLIASGNTGIDAANLEFSSMLGGGDITLHVDKLNAGTLISGIDLEASRQSPTGDIVLRTQGNLTIHASDTILGSQLASGGNLVAKAQNDITYNSLISYGSVDLNSEQGTISLQNRTAAAGDITLTAKSLDLSNNRSKIQTARTLTLNGDSINVSDSSLLYGGLTINAKNLLQAQNASLKAVKVSGGTGDITLNIPSLTTNQSTNILADGDLNIITSNIDNYGQLASGKDLTLKVSGSLTNRSTGLIYAGNNGNLFVNDAILNEFGAIITQGNLKFANVNGDGKNASLINKAGLIQAGKNLSIQTQYLKNEADSEPVITISTKDTGLISFDHPEHYQELAQFGQLLDMDKMDSYPFPYIDPSYGTPLGHDNKSNTWGAIRTDNNDTARVEAAIYQSKEDAYSSLVIDGITYKADNWILGYTRRDKRIEFYYLNPLAGMKKTETGQSFNVDTIKSGLIQANGDLNIDVDVLDNKYSNIEAGNDATINAQIINNIGATAYTTSGITCVSTSQCFAYNADGSRNASKDIGAGSTIATGMVATKSFSAVIKAGGNLKLNAGTLNNTVAENTMSGHANYEAKGSSGNPLDALNGLTAGGALFTPKVDLTAGGFTPGQQLPDPKPNSGGFGGTLPNQNFIYETRAAFMDVGKFYGSSYYMNRIGYMPDRQILFLGDAYFENQLIDKQMRDLIGQGLGKGSFVPGDDPIDQMKALLDAGADYSAENGLAFGQALTPEQVAALDTSIVVYVKQSINGAEVYAPVLYVAAKDKASVTASGSKIEGGSVNITTDNITHSGLIASNSDLKLQGTNILSNGGGFTASGNLILASTGKLELNAGTTNLNGQSVVVPTQAINAGGTALLQADKDLNLNGVNVKAGESIGLSGENVNIGTAKATTANGSENVTGSQIEAGKDIQVKADQNITVTGSSVTAGDRLAMSAENGNLTIQSAEANRLENNKLTTTQQKSEINSGGSTSLSADKNVVIAGSDVNSGGSLGIKAGESVAIVATQDTSHEQVAKRTTDTITQQSSNVTSQKDMGVKAGQDILIGASNVKAGGNVALEAQGDITVTAMANKQEDHVNGGKFKMNREETTQVGSSIAAGGNLTAIAGQDGESHNLNIIGSTLEADGKVGLKATNDINILAAEDSYHQDIKEKSKSGGLLKKKSSSSSSDDSTTTVGSSISGGDGVNIQSGGNTTISASDIMAGTAEKTADLNISAGGNLIVASGKDVASSSSSSKNKGFLKGSSKSNETYDETTIASNLGATGNVNLYAEGHALISGSNVVAGEDINIEGSSVSIIGAQEDHHSKTSKSKTGFGVGSGEGFYSIYGSKTKTNTQDRTDNVGSNLVAGGDVNLTARDTDVNVIGSQIVAGNDINLDAERDVNILPGHESKSESETEKRSGFGIQLQHTNSSASIGIGVAKATDKKSEDHATNAKSGLNAGNDVNISAGRDANLVADDVTAGRDVNIYAENDVNLLAANDVSNYDEMHERLFAGVTVQVGSNVLNAAQDIADAVDRAGKGGSGMEGLSNIAIAGANIYGTKKPLEAAKDTIGQLANGKISPQDALKNGSLINGSITAGFTHSKTESSSTTSTPVVTTIDAGRSVNIEANKGSINGVGVQINAGSDIFWNLIGDDKAGDINLTAGKEINLVSAVGTQDSKSKSTSSGAQIGVDLSMTPTGNAYLDKGKSNSDGTYHVNSHVTGTGTVTLKSGGDTNLKGAVIEGNSVKADIGGNLNIESQLDTENVKIDHSTISGGYGSGTASFDYTKQKGKGESHTVSEQSGIKAGNGGYDIKVEGNTDLKGGVISSTAPEEKNSLETGTLTWSDIETGSEWETKTSGFGGTIGTGGNGAAGTGPLIKPTLKDGDKDEGSAKAAVSPGTITIKNPDKQLQDLAELNRDTTNTNDAIKGLPDLQAKLNEQLKTQQDWAKAAQNMATAVKDYADSQFAKAQKADDKNAEALWKEGGAARAALHAIAGGLLGGVNGVDGAIKAAIGAGVSTLIAPHIKKIVDDAVKQSGLSGPEAKRVSDALTSSIVLGLLAGSGGSDTAGYASNEIKYNFLKEDEVKKYKKELEDAYEEYEKTCLISSSLGLCRGKEAYDQKVAEIRERAFEQHKENLAAMAEACEGGYNTPSCSSWKSEFDKMLSTPELLRWNNVLLENLETGDFAASNKAISEALNKIQSGSKEGDFVGAYNAAYSAALSNITGSVRLPNMGGKGKSGIIGILITLFALKAAEDTKNSLLNEKNDDNKTPSPPKTGSQNGGTAPASPDPDDEGNGSNENSRNDPFNKEKDGAKFRQAYNEIKSGNGTPRTNTNGQQTIFQGRQPSQYKGTNINPNRSWAGAKEWDVPGDTSGRLRLLEQKLPNGGTRWGLVRNHYDIIKEIKGLYEAPFK